MQTEAVYNPRIPIQSPEYRYPPSRNPYYLKVRELPGRIYSDNATEAHRGEWRGKFLDSKSKPKRTLRVELGCNGGHVILEEAARDPKSAFIGLDWKFKQVFLGAQKAQKRDLGNLIFFRSNAERLQYMFGPDEIDELRLFFPDPWPKKAQWKHRFLTADRLRMIAPLLAPGGVFHIKTDHAGYFEWMEEAIAQVGDLWEPFERTTDLHAGNPDAAKLQIPDVTLFERIFVAKGIKINQVKLRRK